MESDQYELTVEDREHYLYAHLMAPQISLDIAVRYNNELMALIRETPHTKVLFVREAPTLDSQAQCGIVASLMTNTLPSHKKLAVVHPPAAHRWIKESIPALQERKDINAFETFAEAEAWLLNDHPQ
jgi:hypothetical protein